MARARVLWIITGVREAASVSIRTRLTRGETPITRPTSPFSLSTGCPTFTPRSAPALTRRVLA